MSDAEYHPVAAGPRVADAMPLVDALLAQSNPLTEATVEVVVAGGSRVVPAYRAMTTFGVAATFDFHVPAEHVTTYDAALGPLFAGGSSGRYDHEDGSDIRLRGTDPEALDAIAGLAEVPVEITVDDAPRATMSPDLIPRETTSLRAAVEWTAWWPAVPELDLGPHLKHAAVVLFVNCTRLWDLEPGDPGFRLYVATEWGGHARAAHLAAAVGLSVIGPSVGY